MSARTTEEAGRNYARAMIAAGNHPMMVADQARLDMQPAEGRLTEAGEKFLRGVIAEAEEREALSDR